MYYIVYNFNMYLYLIYYLCFKYFWSAFTFFWNCPHAYRNCQDPGTPRWSHHITQITRILRQKEKASHRRPKGLPWDAFWIRLLQITACFWSSVKLSSSWDLTFHSSQFLHLLYICTPIIRHTFCVVSLRGRLRRSEGLHQRYRRSWYPCRRIQEVHRTLLQYW